MEKKRKKTFIIFLIGFIIGVIGFVSSFSMYLSKSPETKKDNNVGDNKGVIQGGLVFNSIDDSLYLEEAIPTLDKFGVMEKGFSFSIKNNNLRSINYELKLEDDNSTIRNSDVRYELTKNGEVLGIYTLADDGIIDKSIIKEKAEIKYTIKLWLDYNSVVKVGRLNKKIAIKEISSGESDINKPVLVKGMIPVYYDNNTNSWNKADVNKWYSYEDGNWANVVTINSDKRAYYEESPVDTKIAIDDINSMWVWIPRFNYLLDKDDVIINFVSNSENAYQAFSFNEHELDGFWFTKFESGLKKDSDCITNGLTKQCNNMNNTFYFVPNYPFATKMTLSNIFYAIRKMELKNNIYGFDGTGTKVNNDGTIKNDNNNIDIHMIKNSEWQAVALLSSSEYGIGKKIENNNSLFAGKAYVDNTEYEYNVLNKGELGSTTGNVTGIYDMAGGKREYVMINSSELNIFNKESNSGFTTTVKDYYYDNEFNELDTTEKLKNKYTSDNLINNEPVTRGGYKNTGNIFNLYGATDYIDKVSVETNSRASLVIIKENENEKKKES